jgi:hypothetical protein
VTCLVAQPHDREEGIGAVLLSRYLGDGDRGLERVRVGCERSSTSVAADHQMSGVSSKDSRAYRPRCGRNAALSFCSNDATVISSLVEAHPVRRAAIEHSPSVDLQPRLK